MKRHVNPLILPSISLLALLLFGVWCAFAFRWFPHSEFGYFGRFNRVKNVLQSMPGVEIVDTWQHQDVTLEDFSFTILLHGTHQQKLMFWEKDIKKLPRRKAALRQHLEQRMESPTHSKEK